MKPTLGAIYAQLVELEQIENYAEYDHEMLMETFDLNLHDASTLYLAIQSDSNVKFTLPEDGAAFLEVIQDAQHQSFDGWSNDEIVVIKAFIADVSRNVKDPV